MYLLSTVVISLLANIASAQTPPEFVLETSNNLQVAFGQILVSPGLLLDRSVSQSEPSVATSSALEGTYVILMVDPDARSPDGSPREILHWLQPGVTSSQQSLQNGTSVPLSTNNTAAIASYRGPAPPAELPPRPHRYIQLLFAQPQDFTLPEAFSMFNSQNRSGFDIARFATEANLGPVLAANYFLTQNTSVPTAATGSGAMPSSTSPVTMFTGGAASVGVGSVSVLGLLGVIAQLV